MDGLIMVRTAGVGMILGSPVDGDGTVGVGAGIAGVMPVDGIIHIDMEDITHLIMVEDTTQIMVDIIMEDVMPIIPLVDIIV